MFPYPSFSIVISIYIYQRSAEDSTSTFATALAEDRTPIFTPLLATNDIRNNMAVPFWQGESGFWRQVGRLLTNAPTQDSHLLTLQAPSQDSHSLVLGSAVAGAGMVLSQSSLAAWDPQHEDDIVSRALNIGANLYTTSYPLTGGIGLFRKSGQNDKPRPNAPDPDKRYVPAPKELPGFPEAKVIKGRTPYDGGLRKRWKMPDKKILEWDSQHGEVELYTKKGNHLGAYDPNTGEMIKGPKKDRSIKKYL